jgi:hypothetical protein
MCGCGTCSDRPVITMQITAEYYHNCQFHTVDLSSVFSAVTEHSHFLLPTMKPDLSSEARSQFLDIPTFQHAL